MTTIILIRHGESEANRQGLFAGQIDPDLQEKGLLQAKLTAEHLAENYKIDKVYSSDLQRAYKTAKCLADKLGLSVIADKNLREINGGEWEGVKFDSLITDYPEDFGVWNTDFGKAYCVGGESVGELGDRIMGTLTKIAEENEGKTVAAATHATPVRVAQCIIETGGLDEANNIPWVSNASYTVIEYENGKWSLKLIGEDKHLAELVTSLPSNVFK